MNEWLTYQYKFSIRFRDTDSYGVIHHSNYFCYFEEARYHFAMDVLSLYEDGLKVNNIKFPVLEANCIYKHALTYEQNNFYVDLKFRTVNDSKLEFLYEIKSESDNRRYASGRTVHGVLNQDDKLCLTIPKWLRDMIEGKGCKE